MTDQKLMMRRKYEKHKILLVRPHAEGQISKTYDSVKNTGPSRL